MSSSTQSKPQDIPLATKRQRSQSVHGLNLGSPTEKLLASSPNYTEGCELYPKAMRDTVNQQIDAAVLGKRDPSITAEAERLHEENVKKQKQLIARNPEEQLKLYPGLMRTKLN